MVARALVLTGSNMPRIDRQRVESVHGQAQRVARYLRRQVNGLDPLQTRNVQAMLEAMAAGLDEALHPSVAAPDCDADPQITLVRSEKDSAPGDHDQ